MPGVMITQFVEELPEGKTTPDFTRKPIALTIQEGTANIYVHDNGCSYVVLCFVMLINYKCNNSFIYYFLGKTAVFKAKITGNPTPTITWSRANGEIHYHPDVCLQKFDTASQEHTLQASC